MKRWLFNPFEIVAGWMSLLIGLSIILLTSVIAFYANIHLDGAIDLHVAAHGSFAGSLIEGLVDWISLAILIYISGLIFSKSSIRIVDVFGTQAMARFPFLLACIFSVFFFNNNVIHYFEYKFLKIGQPVEMTSLDIILFGLGTLTTMLTLVWMIVLMYRSYSISCNVKGQKGVISFIVCLILAEILSKILLSFFYTSQS